MNLLESCTPSFRSTWGGLSGVVLDLIREGRRLGQDVAVVCLERPGALAEQAEGLVASIAASSVSAKFSVGIAHSLNATCIALLTWAAMRAPDTPIGRMLHNRTVVVIGTASYSLYLWQQLFLNPGNEGVLCRFPLNLVLAFVAAFASFYLVERPFLALKDRARCRTEMPG